MTPPNAPSEQDGIVRLNPSDGLFLQAVHLRQIQDYARALADAVGMAGGSGVVHGYSLVLKDGTLQVGPGLAVAPNGHPLCSTRVLELPLADESVQGDQFLVVTAGPDNRAFDEESVYGALCDDPCRGGATIQPYVLEDVAVTLEPATMPGLAAQGPANQRSWLASAYFGREQATAARMQAGSAPDPDAFWLRPPGTQLLGLPWAQPTAAPSGDRVPIGVLLWSGGQWVLDMWTARRDRGDPPPRRAWQGRLVMRPSDVFVAEILQFQVQLAELLVGQRAPAYGAARLSGQQLHTRLAEIHDELVTNGGAKRLTAAAEKGKRAAAAEKLAELTAAADPGNASLPELGIHELPPAGFLPVAGVPERLRTDVWALLPDDLADLRFRSCRADEIGAEMEAVQHGDRIRLDAPREAIDILVPQPENDASYPWVAFVRRRGSVEDVDARDEVEVVLWESDDKEELAQVQSQVERTGPNAVPNDAARQSHTASFPRDAWALPVPDDAYVMLHDPGLIDRTADTTVVTCVSSQPRRPLGAARATLVAGAFDNSDRNFTSRFTVLPAVPEAIVVLVRVAVNK